MLVVPNFHKPELIHGVGYGSILPLCSLCTAESRGTAFTISMLKTETLEEGRGLQREFECT